MSPAALLLLLAAAPDLTLRPPPLASPDGGASVSGPDVTAIFRVGHEGKQPGDREYKLRKNTDGSYTWDDDIRFVARIAPDGGVSFRDRPALGLRRPDILGMPARSWSSGGFKKLLNAHRRGEAPDPMTGASPYHGNAANERDRNCVNGRLGCWAPPMVSGGLSVDATDAIMRAHGQDPYGYEKKRFLEATSELRIGLAVESRRRLLKEALDALPRRLEDLWTDERWSEAERRHIVTLLLAEIDLEEQAGVRAAEIIRRFACTHFPADARQQVPGLTCK